MQVWVQNKDCCCRCSKLWNIQLKKTSCGSWKPNFPLPSTLPPPPPPTALPLFQQARQLFWQRFTFRVTFFIQRIFSFWEIRKASSVFIFLSARERAESNKSCNLIGSWSGRNFLIRTATAGGIRRSSWSIFVIQFAVIINLSPLFGQPYLADSISLQSANCNILGPAATVVFFANEARFTQI